MSGQIYTLANLSPGNETPYSWNRRLDGSENHFGWFRVQKCLVLPSRNQTMIPWSASNSPGSTFASYSSIFKSPVKRHVKEQKGASELLVSAC